MIKKFEAGGDAMLPWWITIIVFIGGVCFGAVLMGVCAYDNVKRCQTGKRWWED